MVWSAIGNIGTVGALVIDWGVLENIGIAGALVIVVLFGFRVFKLFADRWEASDKIVRVNAEAQDRLAQVLETNQRQSAIFNAELVELLKKTYVKVSAIHTEVICSEDDKKKLRGGDSNVW